MAGIKKSDLSYIPDRPVYVYQGLNAELGNGNDAFVYAYLALYVLPDGEWHVFSATELAIATGFTVGQARRTLERLIQSEYLDGFNVKGATKAYRLHNKSGEVPVEAVESRRPIRTAIRMAVFSRDNFQCVQCGSGVRLSIDHVHPRSLGGSDDINNLQTLCMPCNAAKGVCA